KDITPKQATERAAQLGVAIREAAKDALPAKGKESVASKITGLEKGWLGAGLGKLLGIEPKKEKEDAKGKGFLTKATGLEKGWLGNFLKDLATGKEQAEKLNLP